MGKMVDKLRQSAEKKDRHGFLETRAELETIGLRA